MRKLDYKKYRDKYDPFSISKREQYIIEFQDFEYIDAGIQFYAK